MSIIKLKILDQTGHTLSASPAGETVSLVYTGRYQSGDRVAEEAELARRRNLALNPYDSHGIRCPGSLNTGARKMDDGNIYGMLPPPASSGGSGGKISD